MLQWRHVLSVRMESGENAVKCSKEKKQPLPGVEVAGDIDQVGMCSLPFVAVGAKMTSRSSHETSCPANSLVPYSERLYEVFVVMISDSLENWYMEKTGKSLSLTCSVKTGSHKFVSLKKWTISWRNEEKSQGPSTSESLISVLLGIGCNLNLCSVWMSVWYWRHFISMYYTFRTAADAWLYTQRPCIRSGFKFALMNNPLLDFIKQEKLVRDNV